jgi:hypothetical protein
VAVGYQALITENASFNTAVGTVALTGASGSNNTALGNNSASAVTAGIGNTSLGSSSGLIINTGNFNTSIGYVAYPLANSNNYTAIGYSAGGNWSNADNRIEIGNTAIVNIGGNVGWSTLSDKRVKTNMQEDVPGLAFISLLHPVTYNLDIKKQMTLRGKNAKQTGDWESKYDIEKIKMSGFAAQDVLFAARSIGYDFSGVDVPKDGGLMSLRYSEFVVPLVKAVQEQQQLIINQQKAIDELLKRVEKLEKK